MHQRKNLKSMFWEVEIIMIYLFKFKGTGTYNITPIL
jgi:hypothetical protein